MLGLAVADAAGVAVRHATTTMRAHHSEREVALPRAIERECSRGHRTRNLSIRPDRASELEHRPGDLVGGAVGDRGRGAVEHEQPGSGDLARERLAVADREERVPATDLRPPRQAKLIVVRLRRAP
jgi:hypothetical protein